MYSDRGKTEILLRAETYTTEDGLVYTGYGFSVFREPEHKLIFTVKDLSTDRSAVESLIRLIRENDVSPIHYEDLIEDFLV